MSTLSKRVQDQGEQMSGPNDILIGHTTICEAASLIADRKPDSDQSTFSRSRTLFRLLLI
jgi:hypothetical protein